MCSVLGTQVFALDAHTQRKATLIGDGRRVVHDQDLRKASGVSPKLLIKINVYY